MARMRGFRFIHVFYEGEPDENGVVRQHSLLEGNECSCEPKCVRVSPNTILVIHDPENGLVTVEDKGIFE